MTISQDGRLNGMGTGLFFPGYFSTKEIKQMEKEQEYDAGLTRTVEIIKAISENPHISDIINSPDPREALPLLAEITNYTADEIAAAIIETEG